MNIEDRIDLFKRVMEKNGDTLSPTVAKRLMMNDKKQAAILPASKIADNLVQREEVIYASNAVSNALNQFLRAYIVNPTSLQMVIQLEERWGFLKFYKNFVGK